MDNDAHDEMAEGSLVGDPESAAPEPRPGRTPPAILPPLEFTPPESDAPAPPHHAHKPPPPPRPPRTVSEWVRILGVIFVPPCVAVLCCMFLLIYLAPHGYPRFTPYRILDTQGTIAVIGFWVGIVLGELAGIYLWLRFTAPDDLADPPPPPSPPA